MNKKVVIILIITLLILSIALFAFSNIEDEKKDVGNDDVTEKVEKENVTNDTVVEESNKEEDSEVSSSPLEFGVNQQYTDTNFLFTLKKYEVNNNSYKYKFQVLNINDKEEVLDYSLFKCVVNQQSVDINEVGTLTIESKEKKNIDITCNGEGSDVYLTYLSTMFDGEEVLVSFGKK